MDLKSPKSPGWKNKFETLTRRKPRDDQDDIMAELDIMTENLRQIEVHKELKHLRMKPKIYISKMTFDMENNRPLFIDDTNNKEIIFCFQSGGLQFSGGDKIKQDELFKAPSVILSDEQRTESRFEEKKIKKKFPFLSSCRNDK